MITSPENSKIKFLKTLLSAQGRKKSSFCIIEGYKLLHEALIAGHPVENIFYSPKAFELSERNFLEEILKKEIIKSYFISDSLMMSLSDTVTPQGILAVIRTELTCPEDIDFSNHIWLLAYEIQDPGNLGTIIRTADAAGVYGIFLSQGTVEVTNPKVLRASMGSFFHIKLFKLKNIESFILNSKKKLVTFISTSSSSGKEYFKVNYPSPVVLIAGNEAHGIEKSIISLSDFTVTIPIYGKAESLNVGIASGIILYEIARQRCLNSEE